VSPRGLHVDDKLYFQGSHKQALWEFEKLSNHRICQNVVRTSVIHLAITLCVTCLFIPHFDVIYDQLQSRHTGTWNLFVKLG